MVRKHRDPETHQTCILRSLKGCVSDECQIRARADDEMEDSRDHGTQGATRPSQCAAKTAAETASTTQLQRRYNKVDQSDWEQTKR